MSKIYTTDGKILTDGFPQIQVGNKLYKVDNRKSTYKACQDKLRNLPEGATEDETTDIMLEAFLGAEAFKELTEMDITVSGYVDLLMYVHAAIFEISYEEAKERFQKAAGI